MLVRVVVRVVVVVIENSSSTSGTRTRTSHQRRRAEVPRNAREDDVLMLIMVVRGKFGDGSLVGGFVGGSGLREGPMGGGIVRGWDRVVRF
jgi:hypothetical protein